MNKWIVALVGTLLVSPFAVVALDAFGIGPGFTVEAPEWKSGYNWEYDVAGKARVSGGIPGVIQASESGRITAVRHQEVMNTTTTIGGTSLYSVLEGFRLLRVVEGDRVVYEADTTPQSDARPYASGFADAFYCLTPCGTLLAQYTQDDLNPFLSPTGFTDDRAGPETLGLFDFPLERNKEWRLIAVSDAESGFQLELTAKAVAKEYRNLDGFRPFETIRIEAQLTEASKQAIRTLAHDAAGTEGIDLDLDLDLRFTYWYAPDVKNLIEMETSGFLTGRAAGHGYAGSFRVDISLHQVLSGYGFMEKPERSLDTAQALTTAAWDERGFGGDASPTPWRFHVTGTAVATDARQGETVTFGVADGWAQEDTPRPSVSVPDDVRIEWTHRYLRDGEPVTHKATGGTYSAAINEPGLHRITAHAYDGKGRLTGADDFILEGYTIDTLRIEDPVGLFVSPTRSMTYDVAPGAAWMTATIAAETHAQGTLRLGGPDDSTHAFTEDGTHTVDGPLTAGPWTMEWFDEARLGGLELSVEVRYDRAGGSDAGTGPGSPGLVRWLTPQGTPLVPGLPMLG